MATDDEIERLLREVEGLDKPKSALPPAPPSFAEFRDSIRPRPGFAWVEAMFERHRGDPVRP